MGLILFLATSCSKATPDLGNSYPQEVSITYKVSSTTANSLESITYDNETGGQTSVVGPSLPYTKTILKTVNKYDIVTLGYFVNPAEAVKLEISVNNEVVKSQSYISPNAAMSWSFQ